jgi:hypothetical protein
MKQKDVFKKVGGILKELTEQYEYLQTMEDDLNDLELELFVANAHFLKDHIEILNKLNLQNNQEKKLIIEIQEPPREEKFFEPVVQQVYPAIEYPEEEPADEPTIESIIESIPEPIIEQTIETPEEQPVAHIDLSSDTREDTYSYIREEPEVIRHELILDEAENWDDDEKEEEFEPAVVEAELPVEAEKPDIPIAIDEPIILHETKTPEPVFSLPEPEIIVKPVDDKVPTINQKISAQLAEKATSNTEQLALKPISDIKQAITLNDKLLFVKDLFNGYSLAYSEAIEILNRFKTFEEATHFLNSNYVVKNKWETKPDTTEKFYSLLKRRYS